MGKVYKCKYCGVQFSTDNELYVKVGNRYAHAECYKKHQEETQQLRKLTDLIKSLYTTKEPNWNIIGTQIKKYKDEGMTYYGMYYTLEYFFIIKKNDINKSAGIGIIPYQYKKAQDYYKNINNIYTQKAKVEQSKEKLQEQKEEVVIITNEKPHKKLIEFNY